jgi:hypothetical protein
MSRSDADELASAMTSRNSGCGKSTVSRLLWFQGARTLVYAAAHPGLVRKLPLMANGLERPARCDAMYSSQLR